MNIILFTQDELTRPLPFDDPRGEHLREILRRKPGEGFDAGIINGPRGRAFIRDRDEAGFHLAFEPAGLPPPLYPLALAVGAVRPQTAKKILRECTALGAAEIHFFASGKGDQAYLASSIYREESYRPYLIQGAQQAFCTRLPEVETHQSLGGALRRLAVPGSRHFCLDNYEAQAPLSRFLRDSSPARPGSPERAVLWIGPERGWSDKERGIFREAGIPLLSLGSRVLRTETACVAAAGLVLAALGFLD